MNRAILFPSEVTDTIPVVNTPVRLSPSGRFNFSTFMLVSSL